MVGSAGPMVTSASGAKSTVKPTPASSAASPVPASCGQGHAAGRAIAHGGGPAVSGAPRRATAPPSWSTPIRPGQVRPPERAAFQPTVTPASAGTSTSPVACSGHVVGHDHRSGKMEPLHRGGLGSMVEAGVEGQEHLPGLLLQGHFCHRRGGSVRVPLLRAPAQRRRCLRAGSAVGRRPRCVAAAVSAASCRSGDRKRKPRAPSSTRSGSGAAAPCTTPRRTAPRALPPSGRPQGGSVVAGNWSGWLCEHSHAPCVAKPSSSMLPLH